MAPKQTEWTIEHLATEEPEAAQYIDDWDHSTIASTPSMKERHSSNTTTILRDAGEPAHIIISVGQKRVSLTRQAAKRIFKVLKKFFLGIITKRRMSVEADASTVQPSLGVNGVIV